MPKIHFKKSNLSIDARAGTEFLELYKLHRGSIPLRFGCCKGDCGTCAIRVIEGEENLSCKTKQEIETLKRLSLQDQRLACQCAILGNLVIDQ